MEGIDIVGSKKGKSHLSLRQPCAKRGPGAADVSKDGVRELFNLLLRTVELFNLLKPTGYVTHQQFNIQQLYALPTLNLLCVYLRTNCDLCHLQHKLIGFYNPDEKCLQRGTDWVFK